MFNISYDKNPIVFYARRTKEGVRGTQVTRRIGIRLALDRHSDDYVGHMTITPGGHSDNQNPISISLHWTAVLG